MIDEKKIEEAAEEYAQSEFYYFNPQVSKICFKAGINWFLDNLWHDASEYPFYDKPCVVEIKGYSDSNEEFFRYVEASYCVGGWSMNVTNLTQQEDYEVSRWLYIEDLLKRGK